MELKNALAICLISLFSATLVVLVARALDNQAAKRLEPQLERIGDALEAIQKHGTMVSGRSTEESDGLIVYYFHGNVRCPTCEAIESQAYAALHGEYADAVANGDIRWKTVNYEAEANAELRDRFEVQVPVVVLARMERGEIAKWRRLDEVWALWDDEPKFAEYMLGELQAILAAADVPADAAPQPDDEEAAEEESDLSTLPLPGDSDTN